MSYSHGFEYEHGYPIAARAVGAERAAFIRRTYGHLAGAILAFVALETLLIHVPGMEQNVILPMLRGSWLLVLLAFMVVGWIAQIWAQSDTSRAMQYAGLSLYVVAEAVIFLPLIYLAANWAQDPNVIPIAGIMTLAVFGGLTMAVFVTGRDFSFLRSALSVGTWIALGLIAAACFFPLNLGMLFCFAMVALMSGYILYYTSNVLYHYRTDQHVAAALALFACIATLFWYILQIMMQARR
ncbi:MAG TPA: Bax inhibitor-1 family protein [Gemmataceae bacterium]|nr:Bax inhibitor-1 family protein [Gemmataceae bacterium]